jgi:hypothetical protein
VIVAITIAIAAITAAPVGPPAITMTTSLTAL